MSWLEPGLKGPYKSGRKLSELKSVAGQFELAGAKAQNGGLGRDKRGGVLDPYIEILNIYNPLNMH